MKKYISFLLASIMTLSTTVVSFGANFSDINDVPWAGAETFINQVADSGLMVGENIDGNMVFRAKDPVTLVETAQLVYNLLKATNHLEDKTGLDTKWNTTLTEANIPQWAFTSVSYCLETGLITEAEVKTFVSGASNVQATREQVAGMVGKAIASVDSSASTSSTTTKFGDNGAIATDKIAYIALLSDKTILSGDDLGNFNPKNKINRAEMAVMMTKSNDVLKNVTKEPTTSEPSTSTTTPSSGATTTTPTTPTVPEVPTVGTFTAQIEQMQETGGNTLLALYNGTQVMGYMGDSSVPTTYQDGTKGNFSDVKVGTSVTITYNGSRITNMVINTEAPKQEAAQDQILKGNIASITKEEIRVVKGQPYYFSSRLDITIDGKSKDIKDLINKFEDEDVTDVYVELTLDDRNDVIKVVATTKAKSYEDSGTLKKLTKTKITFEDGTSYKIDEDDITVKYDGGTMTLEKAISKIDDADDDDEFTVEVEINEDKDDYIDKLVIKPKTSSSSSKSGDGTLKSIDGKKIKVGSTTYTTTSSTDFDIDDGENDITSLKKLETALDDDKTIELKVKVKDDKVTEVTGYVSSVTGKLYKVNSDEVTLELDSGRFRYECKSSVDIDAGSCDDLGELDEYNDKEGKIEVELTINSSNQVTKIKEK